MGAAIAQWIRLHLPSCRPGFESQAHYLCFFQFKLKHVEKSKINRKRGRDWPIKKNIDGRTLLNVFSEGQM